MTGRAARTIASVALVFLLTSCTTAYHIQIETPIRSKVDVAPFQRVLIAGFLAGGTDELDTNLETIRLMSSQLRRRSTLQVIDAGVLPLAEIAADQAHEVATNADSKSAEPAVLPPIMTEQDLEPYEHVFANASFWKRLGEEYQQPLIVTGTVVFAPQARSGVVTSEREVYDDFGRRRVVPVRAYQDREGFILSSRFIFIDGRTGAMLASERYREEILRDGQQNTPALASYFELMDRLLPSFIAVLSEQRVRGTRALLK